MKIIKILLMLLLSGCSIHQTTLKQGDGYKIYAMSESDVFQLVYHEVSSVITESTVNDLDGPERGYVTTLRFGPDWYDVFVKIVPVEGEKLDGESVKGYFVDLSGSGTLPTKKPQKVFENIKRQLEKTGTGVFVKSYRKSIYEFERDRWRLNKSASARNKDESVTDKLMKLKVLRDEGVITDEEFNAKKDELLKEL